MMSIGLFLCLKAGLNHGLSTGSKYKLIRTTGVAVVRRDCFLGPVYLHCCRIHQAYSSSGKYAVVLIKGLHHHIAAADIRGRTSRQQP